MTPINLGNSVETAQWENETELRAYPFSPECSVEYPVGVVSDLSIMVDSRVGRDVYMRLCSMHVGSGMVSVSFSDGRSFLVCTVPRGEFVPYMPYRMSAVSGVCGGMCSFGDIDFSHGFTMKFGGSGPHVLDTLVSRVPIGRLKRFVDDVSGNSVSGDVVLDVPVDVLASKKDDGSSHSSGIVLSMSDDLDSRITSPCESSDTGLKVGETSPILSVNGLTPDKDGRIALVFS